MLGALTADEATLALVRKDCENLVEELSATVKGNHMHALVTIRQVPAPRRPPLRDAMLCRIETLLSCASPFRAGRVALSRFTGRIALRGGGLHTAARARRWRSRRWRFATPAKCTRSACRAPSPPAPSAPSAGARAAVDAETVRNTSENGGKCAT